MAEVTNCPKCKSIYIVKQQRAALTDFGGRRITWWEWFCVECKHSWREGFRAFSEQG